MLAVDLAVPLRDFTLRVALDVPADVPLALAGPSGAGKSTLLRAIAGVGLPASGTVRLGAERWLDTAAGVWVAPERRRCALLPQHDTLFGHLPAWRNVAYGMTAVPRARRRGRAQALLERLDAGGLADARPAELSGGERRRVALARALAADPRALLLDEPLTGLDPVTREAATRELRTAIAAAGVPVIIVTHDLAHVAALTPDVAVLERGVLVQRGTAGELAAAPATPFVAALAAERAGAMGDCG